VSASSGIEEGGRGRWWWRGRRSRSGGAGLCVDLRGEEDAFTMKQQDVLGGRKKIR
jgi:hypothetical protein